MQIHILGAHHYESQDTKCISILIDNKIVIDAGGLTSNLSIQNQMNLQAILLTHKHYDHIRDVPMIALSLYRHGASIDIYSTSDVRNTIETHFLNGKVYPRFQEMPEAKPTIRFYPVIPYEPEIIDGYRILALPVNHDGITVGYQVTDNEGKSLFYSADTGPGLIDCWQYLSPQLFVIDVTVPNRYEDLASNSGHLTPGLLKEELVKFQQIRGYLPEIIVVHMDPALEEEIREEIMAVSESLDAPIALAYEDMKLDI
jgi:ribonuclease BN (tRNA processing enzyme)